MSDIPPIARPLSPREAPAELQHFQEAMAAPLQILAEIGRGQALPLTEPHRFEVAKLCAQMDGAGTAEKIQSFVLNKAEDRFEVAKFCLKADLATFLKNIDKFDLKAEQRFELAILCAKADVATFLKNIDMFGLNEAQHFLAKACAEGDFPTFMTFFEKFQFEEEEELSSLMKFFKEVGIDTFIMNIDKFDEEQRLTLAQLCASYSASTFMMNMDKFRIVDLPYMFAEICSESDLSTFIMNIDKFQLDEEQRFAFAKVAVERDMITLIKNFDKFDLTPKQLFDIRGKLTDNIYNVDQLGLNDEQRFEFAKFCIQERPLAFIEHIDRFNLNDEQRFECIKAYTQRGLDPWIDALKLTKNQQFELAKIAGKKNPANMISKLTHLNFERSEWLEIVTLCLYPELAKNMEDAGQFRLTDEQRSELVKRSYEKNLDFTVGNIHMFGLADDQLIDVLSLAVSQDPIYLRQILQLPAGITYCTEILSRMGWVKDQEWEALIKIHPGLQMTLIARAADILFIWSEDTTPEEKDWLLKNRSLVEILALRTADLDTPLADLAKEIAHRPLHFEELSAKYPPLLALPLAKLKNEGANVDALQLNPKDLKDTKKLISFVQSMSQLAQDKILSPVEKTQIIEAISYATTALSLQMTALRNEIAKPAATKADAAPKKQQKAELKRLEGQIRATESLTLTSAGALSTILNCERRDLLQKNPVRNADDLKALASEAFQSILPMPERVDDFWARYEETFGAYRQPNAIEIYASGLKKREACRPALMALSAHVLSVFRGIYTREKYDPTINPHLKKINDYDPNLLLKWQENSQEPLQGFPGLSIHDTDDPQDILLSGTEIPGSCQKVSGDPLLNQGLVGPLRNGQTRLLVIKDKAGRIVARRLSRLLWDKQSNQPVLFLEPLYSSVNNPALDHALLEKAKQMAKDLKCPLTIAIRVPGEAVPGEGVAAEALPAEKAPEDQYENYPNPIHSLGGLSPCEYVDSAGGIMTGPYMIPVNKLRFVPP